MGALRTTSRKRTGIKNLSIELRPVTYHYDVDKTNNLLGVKDSTSWD